MIFSLCLLFHSSSRWVSGKPCRFSVVLKRILLRYETLFTVNLNMLRLAGKKAKSIGDLALNYSSHLLMSNFAIKASMRRRGSSGFR